MTHTPSRFLGLALVSAGALSFLACDGGSEARSLSEIEQLVFVPAASCILLSETSSPVDCSTKVPLLVERFEVDRARWRDWLRSGKTPPEAPLSLENWKSWNGIEASEPATGMTLAEAQSFASERGMRLPTAREWIRVAVGSRRQSYPWGPSARESVANTLELGLRRLVPVGTFQAGCTPSGIFDLIGNAAEWVTDPIRPPIRDLGIDRSGEFQLDYFASARLIERRIAAQLQLRHRIRIAREADQALSQLQLLRARDEKPSSLQRGVALEMAHLGLSSAAFIFERQARRAHNEGLALVVLREVDRLFELLLRRVFQDKPPRRDTRGLDLLNRTFPWGPDIPGSPAIERESEAAKLLDRGIPDIKTWALGGSYLARGREIYRYDLDSEGQVAYNAIVIDPRGRYSDVGLRLVTEAETWLRQAAPRWSASDSMNRGLESLGRQWGRAAVPLLRRLAREKGAPSGLQALLRGAEGR